MAPAAFEPVDMIERLIAFDTTSRESNLALIDFVAEYLEGHGVASILMHNDEGTKANLFATLGPDDAPGVVLSGHTDVVPVDGQDWTSDPFRLTERDGRLYGRGSADMKSFIGIALALVPTFLARKLPVPIQLALSYDEEVGCLGAPTLASHMSQLPGRPRLIIVGEPTGMRVANAHKGIRRYDTSVRGFEAHSSATDKGVSAIMIAGRLIAELDRLAEEMRARADPESGFDPPYTTISVGVIDGGTAPNIIPKDCHFSWEYRLMPGDDPDEIFERLSAYAERLLPDMRAVDASVGIESRQRVWVPGLEPRPGSDAESFAMALAETNATSVASFATEAGIFQQAGVPAVICGPGEISEAHKPDEFIERAQIDACVAFMGRLMDRLAPA